MRCAPKCPRDLKSFVILKVFILNSLVLLLLQGKIECQCYNSVIVSAPPPQFICQDLKDVNSKVQTLRYKYTGNSKMSWRKRFKHSIFGELGIVPIKLMIMHSIFSSQDTGRFASVIQGFVACYLFCDQILHFKNSVKTENLI